MTFYNEITSVTEIISEAGPLALKVYNPHKKLLGKTQSANGTWVVAHYI